MNKFVWIFLALLSGALLPVQAGLNTRLGKVIDSPLYAALISFLVGTIALVAYILITRQSFTWSSLAAVPAHLWTGGLIGAFFVAAIIFIFPQLGPGLSFGLIVTGQMVVSIILEHKNILVAQPHPVNLMKLCGVALVIIGVIIIRKY
jgi:bacterial/archaeal transporter family-2 protein